MQSEYIEIELQHLKAPDTLSFTLYFLNGLSSQYTVAQLANIPLTTEKLEQLKNSNNHYYIHKGQLKTFLSHYELSVDQIPSLAKLKNHPRMMELKADIKKLENYNKQHGEMIFPVEFKRSIFMNDFSKIIEVARLEIQCFALSLSPTVTLANELAKKHLFLDNQLNRKVALTYFMAKHLGLDETTTLAQLVVASFFCNLGMSQLPLNLIRNPKQFNYDKAKKLYQKHPLLSVHLIKKSKVNISEAVIELIHNHHEFLNGSGYPNQKTAIEIGAEGKLLNAIEFVFDFHQSQNIGSTQTLHSTLITLKNSEQFENIRLQLDETVINALISFVSTDNLNNTKKYKNVA